MILIGIFYCASSSRRSLFVHHVVGNAKKTLKKLFVVMTFSGFIALCRLCVCAIFSGRKPCIFYRRPRCLNKQIFVHHVINNNYNLQI